MWRHQKDSANFPERKKPFSKFFNHWREEILSFLNWSHFPLVYSFHKSFVEQPTADKRLSPLVFEDSPMHCLSASGWNRCVEYEWHVLFLSILSPSKCGSGRSTWSHAYWIVAQVVMLCNHTESYVLSLDMSKVRFWIISVSRCPSMRSTSFLVMPNW